MITLEELKNENGFITVFDDDGLVTIQMSIESVTKIIKVFDDYVLNRKEHNEIVKVSEFGNSFDLELSLQNDDEGKEFTLTGTESDSLYHDFELEYCDIKTWKKIKNLCNIV